MSVLSDILTSHGDPAKVAAALGRPAPIAFTPTAQPAPAPVSPTTIPAPMKLNVDRIALTPSASSIAPLPLVNPTTLPQLPKAATSWLDWVTKHWPWLVAALLALLIIAYAGRGKRSEQGFSPSPKGKRIAKGSAEAKAHMARIRAMKKKG